MDVGTAILAYYPVPGLILAYYPVPGFLTRTNYAAFLAQVSEDGKNIRRTKPVPGEYDDVPTSIYAVGCLPETFSAYRFKGALSSGARFPLLYSSLRITFVAVRCSKT